MSWFSRKPTFVDILLDGIENSLKTNHSKWRIANNKSSIFISSIDENDADKPQFEILECGQIEYWTATPEKKADGSVKFKSTPIVISPKQIKRVKQLYHDFLSERALRLLEKVENTK